MDTNLFFELLQVALGRREGLSRVPTACEWKEAYEEAGKQAVTGILLNGMEKLSVEQLPPLDLKLQWIGETQMIEATNRDIDQKCVELLGMLEKVGLRGTILKGQGIARLYGHPDSTDNTAVMNGASLSAQRQPGDIDVYVDCGMEKAMAFAWSLGQKDVSWDYKHLHLKLWEETEVEVHYRVEFLFNLFRNRRLQRWFEAQKEQVQGSRFKVQVGEITTPTVEFNVFYILLHIYQHYFTEGVGMRQIVDYFFVLKEAYRLRLTAYSEKVAVKEYGLERFAKGLMWVMQEVMAMPKEWMLWELDEREGMCILAQVMEGGNFGRHVEGYRSGLKWNYVWNVCRWNIHLLRWYPSEALWAPVWIVYHKLWKMGKRWQLGRI